ncbi:MAG TPA: VOC family protein [Dehalococcoidia bacterium]|nr:VOC family protein [Dehalococcoidia bacterium]
MERPRIRHIALNVQDRDKEAVYYKRVFGLEEKHRGPNGTIYLSDGHVGVALISNPNIPWGINHFGFQVESVVAIEEIAETTAVANSTAAVGESWIRDAEDNRVDLSVEGWPI